MMTNLDDGVVQTFIPSCETIVGRYLYNQIDHVIIGSTKHDFPLLDLYGEAGIQPWVVSDYMKSTRIPHQEFYYFYARLKNLSPKGRGKRCLRRVGSGEAMGTWSETEISKPIIIDGVPFGRVKKFRYENQKSEHHGAWMMEEFSIDHCDVPSSDLVLCRMKRNDKGGCGRKRKAAVDVENDKAKMLRYSVEQGGCCTSASNHHQLGLCNNVDVGDDVIVPQIEAASGFEKDGTTWSFDDAGKMMAICSAVEANTQHETTLSVDDYLAGLEQAYDVSAGGAMILSQIEDAMFQEDGDFWFDEFPLPPLEEEPSLFENHIAAAGGDDVQPTIIGSQSRGNEEEKDGTTGYNSTSTSQAVPDLASDDQMTSFWQDQQDMFPLPAIHDEVASSGFAWDNSNISTNASLCFQIDDFSFLFEN